MRLLKKEKCERRMLKRYDKARTPYMRVLEKMKELIVAPPKTTLLGCWIPR